MKTISGVNIMGEKEVSRLLSDRLKKSWGKDSRFLPLWGNLPIEIMPDHPAHCCAIGADQTARSIMFHKLWASVANARCLALGNTSDLISFINRINPRPKFHCLNPFDKRATAWDIAGDANTPERRLLIASFLAPANPDDSDYSIEAQRAIVAAVMGALHNKAPGAWTLLHLLAALQPFSIAAVLSEYPSTKLVSEKYLNPASYSTPKILASLHSKLQPFYPIASIWQHSTEKISVQAWAGSQDCLVLGNDEPHRQWLVPLNRLLLNIFCVTPLQPLNLPHQRTWIFLPSLENTAAVDFLPKLLADGSKAVFNVYVDMRDLQFLHSHYGLQTLKVLDQFDNFAFFRITDGATARWATEKIASQEVTIPGDNKLSSPQSIIPSTHFSQLAKSNSTAIVDGYLGQHLLPIYKTHKIEEPTGNCVSKLKFWRKRSQDNAACFLPRRETDGVFPQDIEFLLAKIGFGCFQQKRSRAELSRTTALEAFTDDMVGILKLCAIVPSPKPPQVPCQQPAPMAPPLKPVQRVIPTPPTPKPEPDSVFNPDDFPRMDIC